LTRTLKLESDRKSCPTLTEVRHDTAGFCDF
jgi:hypothetical protein